MVELGADFLFSLGEKLDKHNEQHAKKVGAVYQYVFPQQQIQLNGDGDGTLDNPAQYGPIHGRMWSLRRLNISGYTTGTVTCTIDTSGEPIPIPEAGMYTFGRGELVLPAGSRLIFTASDVTSGYVQVNGAADTFETWYFPYYIG